MDTTQHLQLCVKVRAASHTTGTRGLPIPSSPKQPYPLPRLTLATCLLVLALDSYRSHSGRAVSVETVEMNQLPALLVLDTGTGHPPHH